MVAVSQAVGMTTAHGLVKVCCQSLQERLLISSETSAVLDAERREDPNMKAVLEQEVSCPLMLHPNAH